MKNLISILLITLLSCSNAKKPDNYVPLPTDTDEVIQPTEITETGDTTFNQVEQVFKNLSNNKNISSEKKVASFEFKEGDEPDVDVFGPNTELILASATNQQISELLELFKQFTVGTPSDMNQYNKFKEMQTFLTAGTYSLECNYTMEKKDVTDIICLIYGNNRYILLSFGFDIK